MQRAVRVRPGGKLAGGRDRTHCGAGSRGEGRARWLAQLGIRSTKERRKKNTWTPKIQNEKEGKREARKVKLTETEDELLSTLARRGCGEKAKRRKIDTFLRRQTCEDP